MNFSRVDLYRKLLSVNPKNFTRAHTNQAIDICFSFVLSKRQSCCKHCISENLLVIINTNYKLFISKITNKLASQSYDKSKFENCFSDWLSGSFFSESSQAESCVQNSSRIRGEG